MTQVRQREAQRIFEAAVARYQMYPEYCDSGIEWLGEIPAHWDTVRLKLLCEINPGKFGLSNAPADMEVSFLPMENIGENGELDLSEVRELDAVGNGYTHFRDDDVIIAKITPCFENGKGALVRGLVNGVGFGTTELYVLRVRKQVIPEFIYYLTRSTSFRSPGIAMMQGAAGQKRVRTDFIADYPVSLPPIDEQRAITTFLDRQTAKINALIAKKRELITALHEQRSAIISHAVTKGLNPDVPMKDSGIEWVDSIPAHWQVQRLKFVSDVRSGVAKGRKFEGVKTVELPYLRVANVQTGHIDLSDVAEIEVTVSEIERYSLKVGDVLMNEGGDYDKLGRGAVWQGQIEPCLHQNHVFAVRPYQQSLSLWITTLTLAQYARFYFMINSKQSTNLASISSRNLSEFPVIMPPQSEREQILGYIEDETRHIDRLSAKAEETIERLQEYRAALISAAVTGKIDVRTG